MKIVYEKKVEIVFVVLHYMAKEATQKCIEAIKNRIDTINYKIIIVDNASTNNSGEELKELYKLEKCITVIINDKNWGFAKGNNVGFLYAKKYLNPDFIVIMNNDVYIREDNLLCKLQKEYKESGFAVLGPLIMTKDGKCNINPLENNIKTKKDVLKRIAEIKRVIMLNKLYIFRGYAWLSKNIHQLLGKQREQAKGNYIEKKYNVPLHGCFLAFSKAYIEKFDGLDDRTFLYMEEEILYKHAIENKMITVYNPDIIIYHEEDSSTNSIIKSKKEKRDFVYRYSLESCKILLDVYNYYEKLR